MSDETPSWLIKPREPFNSRIWGEIAVYTAAEAMITGSSWLRMEREHGGIRITPESPAAQTDVE